MQSMIVVKSVVGNTWTGEIVMGVNERHTFTLNSDTGAYQVKQESIDKVDWPFVMKRLLPNQKVKQV